MYVIVPSVVPTHMIVFCSKYACNGKLHIGRFQSHDWLPMAMLPETVTPVFMTRCLYFGHQKHAESYQLENLRPHREPLSSEIGSKKMEIVVGLIELAS